MTLLMGVNSADFNYILESTGASRGNISVQIKKLEKADYIKVEKSFGKSYPVTTCQVTEKGRKAYEDYVETISKYLKINNSQANS